MVGVYLYIYISNYNNVIIGLYYIKYRQFSSPGILFIARKLLKCISMPATIPGTPDIVSSTTALCPYLYAKKRSAMNLKNFVIDRANASEVLVMALSSNSLI